MAEILRHAVIAAARLLVILRTGAATGALGAASAASSLAAQHLALCVGGLTFSMLHQVG